MQSCLLHKFLLLSLCIVRISVFYKKNVVILQYIYINIYIIVYELIFLIHTLILKNYPKLYLDTD